MYDILLAEIAGQRGELQASPQRGAAFAVLPDQPGEFLQPHDGGLSFRGGGGGGETPKDPQVFEQISKEYRTDELREVLDFAGYLIDRRQRSVG